MQYVRAARLSLLLDHPKATSIYYFSPREIDLTQILRRESACTHLPGRFDSPPCCGRTRCQHTADCPGGDLIRCALLALLVLAVPAAVADRPLLLQRPAVSAKQVAFVASDLRNALLEIEKMPSSLAAPKRKTKK